MTDVLLTSNLVTELDDVGLSTAYWENGITNNDHLDRIEHYSGIPIPQNVRDFVDSGRNEIPPEKEESSYINQLTDVSLEAKGICYWDGEQMVTRSEDDDDDHRIASSAAKLQWTWTAMEQVLGRRRTEYMERFHSIPTNAAPFTPPVTACITKCVISCAGNRRYDGVEVTIISNSRRLGAFRLPKRQVHGIFSTELLVKPMEQVYIQIRNISNVNLSDIVFTMYLQEI